MYKLLVTLIFFFIISTQIFSQENSTNILEPVTIYGNHLNTNETQSGKNITIISSSDLNNYMFNSIDDLLKLIPSIELQSKGGFSNQSDIVLRGSTFNQTLVLLDGMRVNDPLTGHFNMYIPISVSDIHQIEIIRGGGSSMYGPDAVGGIINIVTKSFNKLQNYEEVVIENKVGQNYFMSNELFISKLSKNSSYSTISSNIAKSDGQELYDDTFSFFDNKTVSISHHFKPSKDLAISLRSSYAKRHFNSKYYYTRSIYDDSNELIKKLWSQAKVDYKINNKSNIDFNYSFQSVNDKYIFMPGLVYKNKTKLFNNRVNYTVNNDKSQLAVGLDFQNRHMESIDRGTQSDRYFGGYVNYRKNVNNLSISPSVRLDYNQSYNFQLCPQIDLNYNHRDIILRASMGRTIRAADFTERYYNNKYNGTLAPGRNIGNPNLDAESTWNAELGIDIKKYKSIKFNNTLFYRKSSNLIDWVLTESSDIPINIDLFEDETYFFAQNISKLYTVGIESELWFVLLNSDDVDVSGSAGYLKIFSSSQAEDLLYDDISSKYLANNSGDKLNYNLSIDLRKVKFNFNGIFKSRQSESDLTINQSLQRSYFIHNIEVNLSLSKNTTCSAEIMNIFNDEYADFLGAIMPKRWVLLGFNYQI